HLRLVNALVETKAIRKLLISRVPKHQLAAADHYGYVAGGDMEAIQQALYIRVAFKIDVGIGMSIAHQELFDPKGIGGMSGADQYNISDAGGHQFDPAEN